MKTFSICVLFFIFTIVNSVKSIEASENCVNILTPKIKRCDKRFQDTDIFCDNGYKEIDSICKGKDTHECNLKYDSHKTTCAGHLYYDFRVCGLIYRAYINECVAAKERKEAFEELEELKQIAWGRKKT